MSLRYKISEFFDICCSFPKNISTGKPRSGKSSLLKVPAGLTSGASAPTTIESMIKVENRNAMAKCYFSAIEPKNMAVTIPTDWEVVNHADSWSDAIEALATVKDHFFAIPGYGDAVVHVERRVGRIHVFLHSFSENEISAKEVRSRILEASSNDEETSEGEEGSFCTIYSPTSVVNSTLNKTGKTEYHSVIGRSNY